MKFLNTETIKEHMNAVRTGEIGSLAESVIKKVFVNESGFVLVNWKTQDIHEGLFESRTLAEAAMNELSNKTDFLIVAKTIAEAKQPEGQEGAQ